MAIRFWSCMCRMHLGSTRGIFLPGAVGARRNTTTARLVKAVCMILETVPVGSGTFFPMVGNKTVVRAGNAFLAIFYLRLTR